MPFLLASNPVRLKRAFLFPGSEGIVTFTFVGTLWHILGYSKPAMCGLDTKDFIELKVALPDLLVACTSRKAKGQEAISCRLIWAH